MKGRGSVTLHAGAQNRGPGIDHTILYSLSCKDPENGTPNFGKLPDHCSGPSTQGVELRNAKLFRV